MKFNIIEKLILKRHVVVENSRVLLIPNDPMTIQIKIYSSLQPHILLLFAQIIWDVPLNKHFKIREAPRRLDCDMYSINVSTVRRLVGSQIHHKKNSILALVT